MNENRTTGRRLESCVSHRALQKVSSTSWHEAARLVFRGTELCFAVGCLLFRGTQLNEQSQQVRTAFDATRSSCVLRHSGVQSGFVWLAHAARFVRECRNSVWCDYTPTGTQTDLCNCGEEQCAFKCELPFSLLCVRATTHSHTHREVSGEQRSLLLLSPEGSPERRQPAKL